MIAICAQCGYKLLVQFRDDTEMQTALRATEWICIHINYQWHTVCPACRKELDREKAAKTLAARCGARSSLLVSVDVGDAHVGGG